MTERNHTDEKRTEAENTNDRSVPRRSALRTIGAGAAALIGLGVSSNPAAARVPNPSIKTHVGNVKVVNQQSTRIGREYIYVVKLKNTSDRTREINGYGKGMYNTYAPRKIPGHSTGKFVFKPTKPLDRIVFK